ncbi:glycine zipper 2TM domain-containing protein [Alcanivorax sp. 1008]|uniref:glycine zipper 2TM domain-containing protein n=1 Tax=Alcanivorax sp. 1008 TaxID=2816853 RepID=UPI001D928E24|nr:glycine zipper 2TM domain-containing protein [Alcanivorax sp. 1008]MCC1495484.1 glycine zipper 2TM domain-containing protein [Alcanivorax sp. 1008]
MKTVAVAVLSAAGAFAVTGAGYGLYHAGASQAAQVAQVPMEVTAEPAVATRQPVALVQTRAPNPVPTPVYAPVQQRPPQQARVMHVEPLTTSWQEPREVCQMVTVQKQAPVRDESRIAGTLLGAAAGGLLGNQVGGGSGKKVATVIGALAGAQLGKQTAERTARTYTTTEQQCSTVSETVSRTTGYLVTYELNGQLQSIKTSNKPGDYLPIENGRVVAF